MAGGFDEWQKDAFFAAAEEVQESADVMESLYRAWLNDRSNGVSLQAFDGLQRELQTALGTAKWQLEQFERAVNQSYNNASIQQNTITRHRQFVEALENQISCVEQAVNDSSADIRKQGFHCVNLDEGEREDLVAFLSAPPLGPSQETMRRHGSPTRESSQQIAPRPILDDRRGTTMANMDLNTKEVSRNVLYCSDNSSFEDVQMPAIDKILSKSDCDWKINIVDGEIESQIFYRTGRNALSRPSSSHSLVKRVENLVKLKWLQNGFRKAKSDEHLPLTNDLPNRQESSGSFQVAQRLNKLTERSRKCLSGWKGTLIRYENSDRTTQLCAKGLRIISLLFLGAILIGPFLIYSR